MVAVYQQETKNMAGRVRSFSLFALVVFLLVAAGVPAAQSDILGRWDLTVGNAPNTYPSWFELTSKDGKLAGRFVGKVGSARPIKQIEFSGSTLKFSLPPQYENIKKDISFTGTFVGGQFKGTTDGEDGVLPWVAVKAPALPKPANPKWGKPISLFNGKDMSGWKLKIPSLPNGWKVVDGVMQNTMPSSDIVTEQQFGDFKLHLEFNVAPKSNSGIYLRGRYEIQVQDDNGKAPESHLVGGLYGFIDPTENAARKAGEWQTYDITLLGRWVTVTLNGKTVIDDKEIPGITGGALHSREADAGPLMLQGDHGAVAYRNVVLTPVVK
jgi:hypothetical protein